MNAKATPTTRRKRSQEPKPVGPRTNIAGRDLRVGDLVLVNDGAGEVLGLVAGAYKLGTQWRLQLAQVPGTRVGYVPQSVPLRSVKQWWRKQGRR